MINITKDSPTGRIKPNRNILKSIMFAERYGNDIPINEDFRKLEDRVLARSKKEDLNLGDL